MLMQASVIDALVKRVANSRQIEDLDFRQDFWTVYPVLRNLRSIEGIAAKSSDSVTYVPYSFLSALPSADYPTSLRDFLALRYREQDGQTQQFRPFGALTPERQDAVVSLVITNPAYLDWLAEYLNWQLDQGRRFSSFTAFNSQQRDALTRVFSAIESVANIKFVLAGSAEANGVTFVGPEMRFGNSAQPVTQSSALNYRDMSIDGRLINDVLINNLLTTNLGGANGTAIADNESGFHIVLHEVLHALGMDHPFASPGPVLGSDTDSTAFTALSSTGSYDRITPGLFDIGTLQALYGSRTQASGTIDPTRGNLGTSYSNRQINTTYQLQSIVSNGSGQVAIWDTNGADTLDATGVNVDTKLDLRDGQQSSVINLSRTERQVVAIAYGTTIENAKGGSKDDEIRGNQVVNILEGGNGNDTLDGGTAAGQRWTDDGVQDRLVGGAGSDKYYLHLGAGGTPNVKDVIIDHDTSGTNGDKNMIVGIDNAGKHISFNNVRMFAASSGATTFESADGRFGATRNSPVTITDTATNMAVILGDDAGDFQNGDFGIRLEAFRENPVIATPASNIYGGDPEDQSAAAGLQVGYDSLGNIIVVTGSYATSSHADLLAGSIESDQILSGPGNDTVNAAQSFGTTSATGDTIDLGGGDDQAQCGDGNDKVIGGAGDDRVTAGAGDDWVQLGADADWVAAGAGDDLAEGGDGRDVALGQAGNDNLYADAKVEIATFAANAAQLNGSGSSDSAGDFLDGGGGNDYLVGGDLADLLSGGMGEDLIVGRGGDDNILGDVTADQVEQNWTVARNFDSQSGVYWFSYTNVHQVAVSDGVGPVNAASYGDADAIYAGSGDDWVFAGAGDDYIDAGDGDDVVLGERGADVILLGAGNDVATGDSGNTTLGDGGTPSASHAYDDYLDGGAGDDVLFGSYGSDILIGGDGADLLVGDGNAVTYWDGADVLIGGAGNDTLYGGYGRDTYVFNAGDGEDYVVDPDDNTTSGSAANKSIFVFGAGISRESIVFRRGSFMIDVGSGNKIHLELPFGQTDPSLTQMFERLEFSDGSVMTWAQALEQGFRFDGGANADELWGTAAKDLIHGLGGNDVLHGLDGNDVLEGGDGNDLLHGEGGDDVLRGGAGNDTYFLEFGSGRDVIEDSAGDNVLSLSVTSLSQTTLARDGNDLVIARRGSADSLTLRDGFSSSGTTGWTIAWNGNVMSLATFVGAGALAYAVDSAALTALYSARFGGSPPTFNGDAGANTLFGPLRGVYDGQGGSDNLAALYNSTNDRQRGSVGTLLRGGSGDDALVGGGDDDILEGGTGDDAMDGGAGEDHYVVFASNGHDTIIDRGGVVYVNANDLAQLDYARAGVGGVDRVYLPDGVTAADLTYSWSDEWIDLERNAAAAHGVAQGRAPFPLKTLTAMLTIGWNGGAQSIKIAMPHDDDAVDFGIEELRFSNGASMNRTDLLAAAGPHDLNPNQAANVVTGIGVDGEGGNDTITVSGLSRGGEGDDSLTGGSGRDALAGDEGSDTLIGGGGDDLLGFGMREFKGAGNAYTGGTGNDILLGSRSSDVFYFDIGDGLDSIGDFWRAPGNSPQAQGLIPIPGSGGWSTNYEISQAAYSITANNFYTGSDTLRFGSGIAPSSITFVRAARIDYGTGNPDPSSAAIADVNGDDLVLTIDGANHVRLVGWYQTTISVFDDPSDEFVDVSLPRGLTRVEFADGTVWDATYLNARSNNVVTGTSGNDVLYGTSGPDLILGHAGSDALDGGDGADAMIGGAGNDTLDGGGGADTLIGGTGDDRYLVDNAGDVVVENAGDEGWDFIEAVTNYTIAANVEALLLLNGASGTGNAGDNHLQGIYDAASNILTGLDGNDWYVIGANDVVVEAVNGGYDAVQVDFGGYTLGANIEKLVLAGSGAINGAGNAFDNWLAGNGAANTLSGGAGNDALDGGGGADTLIGGTGDDCYLVDNAGDVVVENAGEGGWDFIEAMTDYTIAANVEALLLRNGASGTGNAGDNHLQGFHDAGSNTMTGLGGSDWYAVGRGGGVDTVVENTTDAGTDVLLFMSGVAKDQLWFRHVGDDLEASILGTGDKAIIKNWYIDSTRPVEQIKTQDGDQTLTAAQVEALISAMAAVSATPPAITAVPNTGSYTNVYNAIAANWQ